MNENKRKAKRKISTLFLVFALLIFALQFLMRRSPALAESYARTAFPALIWLPREVINLIPFSVSQLAAIVLLIYFLYLLLSTILRFAKGEDPKRTLLSFIKPVFFILAVFMVLFFLNFGYTYHRESLADNLGLTLQKRSPQELYEVAVWLVEEVNQASKQVSRDENQVMTSRLSQTEILKTAYLGYREAAKESDVPFVQDHLFQGSVRVKGVNRGLSHLWSYTGITGIYIPIFLESNVNTDIPLNEMLATSLHEVAHSYGFAREDEANFLAFYSGIHHPDPDLRYAAYLHGLIYVVDKLHENDKTLYRNAMSNLDAGPRADIKARNVYWAAFEGPVKEVSTKVNDTYLRSNAQEQGVKSYEEMVDLMLAYYFQKIAPKTP